MVFMRFGPPVVLYSDQGANFESTLMHEVCNIIGITKTRTTAYHPSGDGQVERQNRTLQDMLANYVSTRTDDWDVWLDPVVYAYNTSRHESTGFSPGIRKTPSHSVRAGIRCGRAKAQYSNRICTNS